MPRRPTIVAAVAAALLLATVPAGGQGGRTGPVREAIDADLAGETARAREILQTILDSATAPADRAAVHRAIAMSHAFDGDCTNTMRHELMVIDYWRTREAAEPQDAFYQQGEMANEGARVCVDAGDLEAAERGYRLGYELGNREPEPRSHPRSLWDFRLAHALGRIAARRGDADEATRQVAAARAALDGDPAMAGEQAQFLPYLMGYVALHTGNMAMAERELTRATELRARDPFVHVLLGMVYEQQGRGDDAMAIFRKAYDLATAHNPPAAFARPFARQKLGL